ncbi:DnaD domain-containing protein [Texcoconibacillus texcoconensis]|uniref:DNA replication protein n=1 Tax=Texcoconibacillus texcoconensis TaxID=1095777 RepID=A0A840QQH2_9BACI|nr:DnaD domain-containing protein [Texcoconibacillus texcoconensis]MBB5173588.1 DNA replication protein [Texcoconibacillus texcoconensis]
MNKQLLINWIQEGTVSLPARLLKTYRTLGIDERELVLIIHIYSFLDEGVTFPTPDVLSERMTVDAMTCSSLLRSLVQKGVLEIKENNSEGIIEEAYSLDPLYEKMAQHMLQEAEVEKETAESTEEGEIFQTFEQEFSRPLSPMELEMLSMWIDDDGHSPDIIRAALREAVVSGKLNFRYIDRILFEWKKNGVRTLSQARSHGESVRQHHVTQRQNETKHSQQPQVVPNFNWLEQRGN